jgi:hypothetical protein
METLHVGELCKIDRTSDRLYYRVVPRTATPCPNSPCKIRYHSTRYANTSTETISTQVTRLVPPSPFSHANSPNDAELGTPRLYSPLERQVHPSQFRLPKCPVSSCLDTLIESGSTRRFARERSVSTASLCDGRTRGRGIDTDQARSMPSPSAPPTFCACGQLRTWDRKIAGVAETQRHPTS